MNKQPVWGIGQQAKSPNVSNVKRLNLYLEFTPSMAEDKTLVTAYGTPGLELFITFGDTPIRGSYEKGDFAYFVHRNTLWQVNNAGVKTAVGTLLTSAGRVMFADNGTQIMIVDGQAGYIYNTALPTSATIQTLNNSGTTATATTLTDHFLLDGQSISVSGNTPVAYNGTFTVTPDPVNTKRFTYTMLSNPGGSASVVGTYTINAFQQITSDGFPTRPTYVTFLAGYFVVSILNSGRYYWNQSPYNGLIWNALDFANAESNPDNTVAVHEDDGRLMLFGEKTTDFAGLSGAQESPFSTIQGASIKWGLAARFTVAKSDNSTMFLGRNRQGEVKVIKCTGNTPQDVTGQEMAHIFNDGSPVSDATAFSYMVDGHSMYQITFPTLGETWMFDDATSLWSQLKSDGITRHLAETHTQYINRNLVTDYSTGNVYFLSKTALTDNGARITRQLIGRHINKSGDMLSVSKLQVEMESGLGVPTGQGSSPLALLRVSKDNGHTWGNYREADIGRIGQYRIRVTFPRIGRSRDFVFELTITDPVPVAITGAYLQ